MSPRQKKQRPDTRLARGSGDGAPSYNSCRSRLCPATFLAVCRDIEKKNSLSMEGSERHGRKHHFAFRSVWLTGLTPIGRATVHVLAMNETRRLEIRALLLADGELP